MADLRVSGDARELYLELTPEVRFPASAWFVEILRDAENGRDGPVLALVLEADGPRFLGVDAAGAPLTEAALELCPACHAGAPAPPLFGVPLKPLESKDPLPR